ncbi:MAG: 3-deoxy-7-phosphoheptulonate synthase [bacterium]
MIIVIKPGATKKHMDEVINKILEYKLKPHISKGTERTIIGVIGDERKLAGVEFEGFPAVEKVMQILKPYKLASREFKKTDTIIKIGKNVEVGGKQIVLIAGPCSVEGRKPLLQVAKLVKEAGAHVLRGGAYKPRTSPYAFQGMAEEGLKILAEARKTYGMPVITEVLDTRHVEVVNKYADVLQIGARNMQNFELLKEVGKTKKPILLKRGLSATIVEWLMSAEYIMASGNMNVILCERGIRTYETATRNTLDLSAVPVVKSLSHLPVVVDPSHAVGKRYLVGTMSLAAVAAGADGILIEVHPKPEEAFSDGEQSLLPQEYAKLVKDMRKVANAVGRTI